MSKNRKKKRVSKVDEVKMLEKELAKSRADLKPYGFTIMDDLVSTSKPIDIEMLKKYAARVDELLK